MGASAASVGTGLAGCGGMPQDNGLVVEALGAAELLWPVSCLPRALACLPRARGMLELRDLFCWSNWPPEASIWYQWLEPPL